MELYQLLLGWLLLLSVMDGVFSQTLARAANGLGIFELNQWPCWGTLSSELHHIVPGLCHVHARHLCSMECFSGSFPTETTDNWTSLWPHDFVHLPQLLRFIGIDLKWCKGNDTWSILVSISGLCWEIHSLVFWFSGLTSQSMHSVCPYAFVHS